MVGYLTSFFGLYGLSFYLCGKLPEFPSLFYLLVVCRTHTIGLKGEVCWGCKWLYN